MKCRNCHTALPDFGRFERRVCPNCGAPALPVPDVTRPTPASTRTAPRADHELQQLARSASKTLDAAIIVLLLSYLLFTLSLSAALLSERLSAGLIGLTAILMILAFLGGLVFLALVMTAFIKRLDLINRINAPNRRLQKQAALQMGAPAFNRLIAPAFFGVICAFLIFVFFFALTDHLDYQNRKDDFVQIEATISRIEEYEDSDGETDHRVYISYTFDGIEYEDVRYRSYKSSMRTGQTLSVYIDPEDPGSLPSDGNAVMVVCGIFLIVLAFVLRSTAIKPLIQRRLGK